MLDMKEKSVKTMMKSGGKNAAPAAEKQEGQNGKGRRNKSKGPDAAPVLPKAKAKGHAGKNGKSEGAGARGQVEAKSTRAGITSKQRRDAYRETNVHFLTARRRSTSWRTCPKERGKESPNPGHPHQKKEDGVCYAFQKGKCENGNSCKCKHELIKKKDSAPATPGDKPQPKSKSAPKAAAPAIVKRAIAMPAIVLKQSVPAGKVSFKKDVDRVEPEEAETFYHERDDDDVMSESSRWSGESEIPEKMVWFKEVLDVDENGEITYLEDESRQWKRKGSGMAMRAMRMVLTNTCTLTKRSSRTAIVENFQPIKSNDH